MKAKRPGTKANLARMLMAGRLGGTGRMVILPVDQGFEHGPARSFAANPAAYDPHYHYQLAIDAGLNAYAAPLGCWLPAPILSPEPFRPSSSSTAPTACRARRKTPIRR